MQTNSQQDWHNLPKFAQMRDVPKRDCEPFHPRVLCFSLWPFGPLGPCGLPLKDPVITLVGPGGAFVPLVLLHVIYVLIRCGNSGSSGMLRPKHAAC